MRIIIELTNSSVEVEAETLKLYKKYLDVFKALKEVRPDLKIQLMKPVEWITKFHPSEIRYIKK
jgi:hypothetical protein